MYELSRFVKRSVNGRAGVAGVAGATALLAIMGLAAFDEKTTAAMQDDKAPATSAARGGSASELEELGETLKAAVLSGTLSEADAIKIYYSMARSLAPDNTKTTARAAEGSDGPYAAKFDLMMLSAPRPGQMSALFRAEFRRRDLQLLRRELDLGRDQMGIIEVLLSDYLEAFELASTPLREALGRYSRSSADQWVAAALQRAHLDEVDVAIANTRDALQRLESAPDKQDTVGDTSPDRTVENEQMRAAREAWARRMVDVTATMQDRVAELRDRVQARLTQMERAGSMVTADDLVRMAHELRRERAQLRAEFTEFLGLIALIERTETERARFDAAVARVRIEHELNHGRLGGESMNLWAALAETGRGDRVRLARPDELLKADALLEERAPGLAATLDNRTKATIAREIRGLDFLVTRDRISAATGARESGERIDPARLASALRPFAEAARREVAASVAVRDELLALLDESSALLDAAYPDSDVSMVYRDAALRRGFRTEMGQRWSERALRAALRLDDLDDESRAALVAMERDVAAALRTLRAEAIAQRIRRDPQRARKRIEAQFETRRSPREKFDLEDFLGFNHQAFMALDERTEDQLRAFLTPQQLASLPARPRAITDGKGTAGSKSKTRG